MKRWMYRALWKDEHVDAAVRVKEYAADLDDHLYRQGVPVCMWFPAGSQLYIYAETTVDAEPSVIPQGVAGRCLQEWPGLSGPRPVVPMLDVFHDGEPFGLDSWRGSRPVERRVGSIAQLKPEMYSSYVYYHYQMQEERPAGFNQTYMIGAHENMLFSYQEMPAPLTLPKREGRLKTNLTPQDWHGLMEPHFIPWRQEEAKGAGNAVLWLELPLIYQYDAESRS